MAQILIVDDDAQLRQSFGKILEGEGFEVRAAPSGEAGVDEVAAAPPDLVIMDVRMPGITGIQAMRQMRASCPGLPVIIMTAYGGTETAIEATKLGAFDYILKPFDIPDILRLIGQALNAGRLARARVAIAPDEGQAAQEDALVGQSRAMQEVFKAIGRAAPTEALVLIRGESGTGKELVAASIHRLSARARGPFITVNCPAIPEHLLESELFGHVKGAFTGAGTSRRGLFVAASGGSILLDEIGDIPMSVQTKLLRVLQEHEVRPVGSSDNVAVDVRILASTNQDLEGRIASGQFRQDLFYRLNVLTITTPSLRVRQEDIPLLAAHFLAQSCAEMRLPPKVLGPEAVACLAERPWPGNVRELQNFIRRLAVFCPGAQVELAHLRQAEGGTGGPGPCATQAEPLAPYKEAKAHVLDGFTKRYVEQVLERSGGNISAAARISGIERVSLQKILKRMGAGGKDDGPPEG